MNVQLTDAREVPLREPGLKALRQEREAREKAERRLSRLEESILGRLEVLEANGGAVTAASFSAAIASVRAELAGDVGRLRGEVRELGEALDQIRRMIHGS